MGVTGKRVEKSGIGGRAPTMAGAGPADLLTQKSKDTLLKVMVQALPEILQAATTRGKRNYSAAADPTKSSISLIIMTRSRGGPGHGTLRRTRTSKQAGKALRSRGDHHARVM